MRTENENVVAKFHKSENPSFVTACAKVPPPWGNRQRDCRGIIIEGIPATKRQASKWLRGKGIAYKVMRGIA